MSGNLPASQGTGQDRSPGRQDWVAPSDTIPFGFAIPGTPSPETSSLSGPTPKASVPPGPAFTTQAGNATRKFLGFYQQIPLVSAPGDIIRAKNGIQVLTEQIQRRPQDPSGYLWLADAIPKAQADGLTYAMIRAILDPTAVIEYFAIRAGSQLGLNEPVPVTIRRKAYLLATAALRAQPSDSPSLYYLARIYLSQNKPYDALRFALMAAKTSGAEPLPHVVAGLAFAHLNRYYEASRVGWMLLGGGSSLGYLPLAECAHGRFFEARTLQALSSMGVQLQANGSILSERQAKVAATSIASRIYKHEAERFYGPLPSGANIVREAIKSQTAKVNKVKGLMN